MLVSCRDALASTDVDTLKSFLARYPGGRPASQVKDRLRRLTRKQGRPSRRVVLTVTAAVGALGVLACVIIWLQVANDSKSDEGFMRKAEPNAIKSQDRLAGGSLQKPLPGGPQSTEVAQTIVAQTVVLYEEDPKEPNGHRYAGSAVWRTETVTRGANQPPEVIVRADIDIPDRKMTMKLTLQSTIDRTLPASHTIEVVFKLPPDFAHGGIQNVPGVLMKASEKARGTPLAGLGVKVTDGWFLIGLSAVEPEMKQNLELLKGWPWLEVPIVYTDGRRATIAVEKGNPGDRAFSAGFAAWKQ
jgi:hypothetical protein